MKIALWILIAMFVPGGTLHIIWRIAQRQDTRRFLCGLRGHVPALEPWSMRLACAGCAYRSPGWDVTPNRRIVRFWRFQRRVGVRRAR